MTSATSLNPETAKLILDDLDTILEVMPLLSKGDLLSIGTRLNQVIAKARELYAAPAIETPAPLANCLDCGKSLTPAEMGLDRCWNCHQASKNMADAPSYLKAVCPDCGKTWTTTKLGRGTVSEVCGICAKPKAQAPAAAPLDLPKIETVTKWAGDIVDGTYTVILPDGDYRTIQIKTQDLDAKFMPGKRLASYLNGPDNWSNYKSFAFINEGNTFKVWQKFSQARDLVLALSILMAGPEAMVNGLKAYGKASGTCGMCGRKLTTPESLALGIGPICAESIGL